MAQAYLCYALNYCHSSFASVGRRVCFSCRRRARSPLTGHRADRLHFALRAWRSRRLTPAGRPGGGKTTLAHLILFAHAAQSFWLRGRLKNRDGSREGALGRMARRERRASPAARPVPTFRYSPPPPRRAVRSPAIAGRPDGPKHPWLARDQPSPFPLRHLGPPRCAQFWLGRRCSSVTDRRGGGGE